MIAWSLTLAFIALSIPPLAANLDLAAALVLDSASKERILERQYAESPCWQLAGWSDEERQELVPGSAEINGWVLAWNEATCSASK